MKTKYKVGQKALAIIITVLSLLTFNPCVYGGQFTNTKLDLSNLKPEDWMTLTFNPATKATLGVRANKAKDGIIFIDNNNYFATEGAGVFAGRMDNKWPEGKAYFVTRMKSPKGTLYKYTGIVGVCKNLFYEGTVTGKVDLMLPNGTTNSFYIAKPTMGSCEKIIETGDSGENVFDIEKDFGDGLIKSTKFGEVEILIVATVDNVQFMLVVDESWDKSN
ncbi:MAG: hypothetical protein KKF30_19015 [Proteobacteria bacterium]|nr:hypothetical protein [Pseudomonadota bacterium]